MLIYLELLTLGSRMSSYRLHSIWYNTALFHRVQQLSAPMIFPAQMMQAGTMLYGSGTAPTLLAHSQQHGLAELPSSKDQRKHELRNCSLRVAVG